MLDKLEEALQSLLPTVKSIIESGDMAQTMMMTLDRENKATIVAMPDLNDPQHADAKHDNLRHVLQMTEAIAYVMLNEAWSLAINAKEGMPKHRVSQDDRRVSVLIATAETMNGVGFLKEYKIDEGEQRHIDIENVYREVYFGRPGDQAMLDGAMFGLFENREKTH